MDQPDQGHPNPLTYDAARRVFVALEFEDQEHSTHFPNIDGYVVERELGAGAGGATFLARKANSEAKVALKILRRALGAQGTSSRVWRELDLLQQLRIASVPRLLDFGAADHSLYLATEYIEGTPLDRHFRSRAPADAAELRDRVEILRRLATAVHTLHEHGIIHRDIKPSNVIIGKGEQPVIVDLGIATLATPDPMETLTLEGVPVGTPAFMAPEQARGHRESISTRSDVYALGAVGYWLCTGTTPHDLSNATLHEAIRRVGSEEPRDPRALASSLPKPLSAVLAKACAAAPEHRYASAAELAEDLGRWLRAEPVVAVARGRWHRTVLWIARHPAAVALVLASIALPVVAVAVAAVLVYLSNFAPAKLVLSGDRSAVSLRARNDHELHLWQPRSARPEGAVLATLLENAGTESPTDRALLVFNGFQQDEPGPMAAIYSTRRPFAPLISFPLPTAIPEKLRYAVPVNPDAVSMGIDVAFLADVFPEQAGPPRDELVFTCHHNRRSAACVRIYSLDGELLFDVWHDGHLTGAYWMPDPGLLILAGVNSEVGWDGRGDTARKGTVYPPVVFAVRPERGTINATVSWPGFAGDLEPAWYKAVLPPTLSDFIDGAATLSQANEFSPAEPYVRMDTGDRRLHPRASSQRAISWIIDSTGSVVTRHATATWAADRDYPSADLAHLGQLPAEAPAPTPEPASPVSQDEPPAASVTSLRPPRAKRTHP